MYRGLAPTTALSPGARRTRRGEDSTRRPVLENQRTHNEDSNRTNRARPWRWYWRGGPARAAPPARTSNSSSIIDGFLASSTLHTCGRNALDLGA